jgi:RecA/RadA recombinase
MDMAMTTSSKAGRNGNTRQQVLLPQPSSEDQIVSQPVSALNLLLEERRERQNRPCFLQHPELALPLGITQLYGAAGAGKTQLALSMCADCVFRNQQAIYIGLGGSNSVGMASKRLKTMVTARLGTTQHNHHGVFSLSSEDISVHSLLSNIFLHWVPNGEDLLDLVEGNLRQFLHFHPNVSLVVLDGIANLFRQPDGSIPNFWQERSTTFFQLSSRCKFLSSVYKVSFLVINGVTTRIRDEAVVGGFGTGTKQSLEPALGLSWNQCVNSTFLVSKETTMNTPKGTLKNSDDPSHTPPARVIRRVLRCQKSPSLPPEASLDFYVDYGGTYRIK